jgi:hypothetical protein
MNNPDTHIAQTAIRGNSVRHITRIGLSQAKGRQAMDDNDARFMWQMIELAWTKAEASHAGKGGAGSLRESILGGVRDYDVAMQPFCWALDDLLADTVTKDGLLSFARAFETHLFALDREDLCAHIGLGDDGFLDARGFIIAMGESYFNRVTADPKAAVPQASVEQAYMAIIRAWETRFACPFPRFGIRVTTGSNLGGWPTRQARADRKARIERIGHDLFADLFCDIGLDASTGPLPHLVRLPAVTTTELEEVLLFVASWVRARREARDGG